MRLEMRQFDVRKVEFGHRTEYADGLLTIKRDELVRLVAQDERLRCAGIEAASPGDPVRITNILEISEPRVKGHVDRYFPGMLGWLERAGTGTTNALRGAAVMEIGSMAGLYGGLVDMAGEGARLSPFSKTHNICLITEPAPGTDLLEYALALKLAGLKASIYLATATKGKRPDETEYLELTPDASRAGSLPRVAYLYQLHSHGDAREPFVYGDNIRRYYPTILHPNEVLDGAIVCGHYNISTSIKNNTYSILNHPVIRGLYRRHGKELDFAGVVISPEPTSMDEIKRTSMMAASLLKYVLGAEGVIMTKEGGGHTDVDLMQSCEECERLGIRTVIIDNEWLGPDGSGELPLLAVSAAADAMVSVGNIDAMIDLPSPERLIGGSTMHDAAGSLEGHLHIPFRFIPNGISQLGFTYTTTEVR